jgi:hypothetical protein
MSMIFIALAAFFALEQVSLPNCAAKELRDGLFFVIW